MTKQTDLLVVEGQQKMAVQPVDTMRSFDVESVFRYAIEHQGSAETLEKLMSIRRELNAEKAKQAFDDALSAFQAECPVIVKEKAGAVTGGRAAYHYAPIEMIEVQIRPVLRKHGFSHSFDTDTGSAQGWVIAKCIVTHVSGHSRTSTAKFPLGTKTGVMSETQVFAAALTFANRRALCNAYGLVLAGEDLDGQGHIKPQGPSKMQPTEPEVKALARELWDILRTVRGDKRDWNEANAWMWREDILDGAVPETAPNLSPARFKEVISKAKERLAA